MAPVGHVFTRILATVVLLVGLSSIDLAAQDRLGLWSSTPSPLVSEMRAGVEAYYGFDYDEALERFDRVVARVPGHPIGYFLRAEAYWWQFLNDRTNERARRRVEGNLDVAIDRAKVRLERDPEDVEAWFILGSAYGRKGLLAGTDRDAWNAARSAQKAKDALDRVEELAPNNADAAAARGLYQYYVGTFGTVTRAASRLLFGLQGDQREGLEALDRARRGGTYTKTEAAFFQGLFYLQFENRPGDALPILDRLRQRYPENLYFGTMAAYARQRQARFEEARSLYERMLAKLGRTGVYGAEGESITRLFYGQTLMAQGEYRAAREEFRRIVQLRAEESDAYPHAYLFLGRLADLRGEREIASRYYRRVLSLPERQDSHEAAERYLDDPFHRNEVDPIVAGR